MKTPGLLLLIGFSISPWCGSSQHLIHVFGDQLNSLSTFPDRIAAPFNPDLDSLCENLVIDFVGVSYASCPGVCDGSIEISASGGTLPYMYSIVGDSCTGLFTIYVTDAEGCIDSTEVIVLSESNLGIFNLDVTNSSDNQSNGSVVVGADNGVPPYLYSIDGVNYQLSPVFTGLAPGAYCITIQDANECSIKSDTFWIENTTGILSIHKDILLYPNPVHSTIYLTCAEPITLDLFDMNGTLLQSSPMSVTHAMDVADLPRGMYVVRMRRDGGSSYQKILLQ